MMPRSSLSWLLVSLVLVSCNRPAEVSTPGKASTRENSPLELIEELRNPDVGKRSVAIQDLRKLGMAAKAGLQKGAHDSDSEVSAWSRTLLDELWEHELKSSAEWKQAREEFAKQREAFASFLKSNNIFVTKPGRSPPELAIKAMGKKALPFAIEEIERGDSTWTWVPASLVGKPIELSLPPSEEQQKQVDQQVKELFSRDWVRWWNDNKHSPVWNAFLTSTPAY